MVQSWLGKILMAPFALLYGLMIGIRNALYDSELVRSTQFSLPVISVGNMSIGGAGKTPHIEYLIRLLTPYINVATLSRGYKRKTKGFRFVKPSDNVLDTGDEPLMYVRKHKGIVVAVGESRSLAIPQMVGKYPDMQAILLDDAFQHRSITPGLNILLTTWDEPFTRDYLLPSGRLREWRSAYSRADIIIVTKCPPTISKAERDEMVAEIAPHDHQRVFFSYYEYGFPYSFYDASKRISLDPDLDVILISAIANTSYLLDYLDREVSDIHHMNYEDHHLFSDLDIEYVDTVYKNRESIRKIILTTEKDAMRLDMHRDRLQELNIPIFVLPAQVKFHSNDAQHFDQDVRDFLLRFEV